MQGRHLDEILSEKVPSGQLRESTQINVEVKKYPVLQIAHYDNCLHCAQLLIIGHFSQIFVERSA